MSDYVTDRSLLSGRVKRYNTWPTITSQTVGDHTWGVYHIYWRIFGIPSAEVSLYIHLHDAEELITGDNPFPMSSMFQSLRTAKDEMEEVARKRLKIPSAQISDEEKVKVKICDLLEMMTFGMQEREMGNLLATPIIERTRAAATVKAIKLAIPDYVQIKEFILTETDRHERVIQKQGSAE